MKLYQHYKGSLYVVTDFTTKDATNKQGHGVNLVVYHSLDTEAQYVRRYDEFHENVEYEGRLGPRFRFIADPADIMPNGGHP